MAQVTIYLDEETEAGMMAAARAEGLSRSRWILRLIQKQIRMSWPPEVAALAGAWRDLSTTNELRSGEVRDLPREEL